MEDKKRKWERDYEEYSNSTELDEKISFLEYAQENNGLNNGLNKEEYKELKKLIAIKENLPKVKNILELKDQLLAQKEEIQKEIAERQKLAKINAECQKLDEEMKKLEEEKVTLEEGLKNNPEKKAEIQGKLKANQAKINQNNKDFGDKQEILLKHKRQEDENAKQGKENKFKGKSTEELQNEVLQISSNISKCNLACNKLMQGYSWQSVEVALDKYEKERYTAKGENAKKIQKNIDAAKDANAKGDVSKTGSKEEAETKAPEAETKAPEAETKAPEDESSATAKTENKDENAIAVQTPWQKFKEWCKELWAKFTGKFYDEVEIDEENLENEENKEDVEEAKENVEEKQSLWTKLKDVVNNIRNKKEKEEAKAPEAEAKAPEAETKALEVEAKTSEVETKAPETTEKQETKQDSFRQYLRDVAAKGIDGVEQDRLAAEKAEKEAKRQAAIEKLKANREGKDTGAKITNLDKQLYGQEDDGR